MPTSIRTDEQKNVPDTHTVEHDMSDIGTEQDVHAKLRNQPYSISGTKVITKLKEYCHNLSTVSTVYSASTFNAFCQNIEVVPMEGGEHYKLGMERRKLMK